MFARFSRCSAPSTWAQGRMKILFEFDLTRKIPARYSEAVQGTLHFRTATHGLCFGISPSVASHPTKIRPHCPCRYPHAMLTGLLAKLVTFDIMSEK